MTATKKPSKYIRNHVCAFRLDDDEFATLERLQEITGRDKSSLIRYLLRKAAMTHWGIITVIPDTDSVMEPTASTPTDKEQ